MVVVPNSRSCDCSKVLILKTQKGDGCLLLDYKPKKSSYSLLNSIVDTGFQAFSPNLQSLCKLSDSTKYSVMAGYDIIFGLNLSPNCAAKITDAKLDKDIWGFSIEKKLNKQDRFAHHFQSKMKGGVITVPSENLDISVE